MVLLGRDQKQVHLTRLRTPLEDLIVDFDVLDIERDVLFGLPLNLLAQLRRRHHGYGDLANDNALPRNADSNVSLANACIAHQFGQGADY